MGYGYRPSGVWLLDPLVHLKNNSSTSLVDDLTQKYDAIYVENHCATNPKVAGSIDDCVIGIFHWHNPSGRTMALGSIQPWRKWVPGIFPGGWRRPVRRADNLNTFMCPMSWNLRARTSWNPQGLSRFVYGELYLYLLHVENNRNILQYKWCYAD